MRIAAIAVVVLFTLFTVPTIIVTAALPGCETCHGDLRDILAQSDDHRDVGCTTCHVAPLIEDRIRFGHATVWGMTVRLAPVSGTGIGSPDDAACESCHTDLTEVTVVDGIRMQHRSCIEGSACVDCHGDVGHEGDRQWPKRSRMDECLACHVKRDVPRACVVCHTDDVEGRVPTSGPLHRVHGAQWERTHGMGDSRLCDTCHAPTFCSGCHGAGVPHGATFFESHGRFAQQDDARCGSCHSTQWCGSCHGIDMPHTIGFVEDHGRIPQDEIDATCYSCHTTQDCDGCHAKHVHPGGAIDSPIAPPAVRRP